MSAFDLNLPSNQRPAPESISPVTSVDTRAPQSAGCSQHGDASDHGIPAYLPWVSDRAPVTADDVSAAPLDAAFLLGESATSANGPSETDCTDRTEDAAWSFDSPVFAVGTSDIGLGLVATHGRDRSGRELTSYTNVVIGPVEDDWDYIAGLIRNVPEVLFPPCTSGLHVRLPLADLSGNQARLLAELESAFPGQIVLIPTEDVSDWVRANSPFIRMPDLGPNDGWCGDLLRSAGETALYARAIRGRVHTAEQPAEPADAPIMTTERVPTELDAFQRGGSAEIIDDKGDSGPAWAKDGASASSATLAGDPPPDAHPIPKNPRGVRASGASYTANHLHIATVEIGADGELHLDERRCASLIFMGRCQTATQELARKVAGFVTQAGADHMLIRAGKKGGSYASKPLSYKVEAVLELAGDTTTKLELSDNIARWAQQQSDLPCPQDLGRTKEWQEGQARAIEAAAYALRCLPEWLKGAAE